MRTLIASFLILAVVGTFVVATAATSTASQVAATEDISWSQLKCLYHPDGCKDKGQGKQVAATQQVTWGEIKCMYHPEGCKPKDNG